MGSASYTASVINGNAVAVSKTDSNSIIAYVGSGVDHVAHGGDLFFILFNAQVTDYYSTANYWERVVWGTVNDASPVIYYYSADELLGNKAPVCNPQDKCDKFNGLTENDKQTILSANVPLQGGTLDPKRYQHVERQLLPGQPIQMFGPDYAGETITGNQYSLAYNSEWDTFNGSQVSVSGSVVYGFDIGMVKVGGTATWAETFQDVRTQSNTDQNAATLLLKTNTVGCYMMVDVYIDSAFGTYLVVPTQVQGCT